MFFWCLGTKTMAKVYWLAKATFFPVLLFFVCFSSGLTSFNFLSVSPLLPFSSALCFLFVLCVFLLRPLLSFFLSLFSLLSLCSFFLSSWFSLFVPPLLSSSSRSFVRPPHSSGLSLAFIKLENAVRSCLKIMRHVRLCYEKKQGPTVLPLQDCWSRHIGIWRWHRGGEVGRW